MIENQYQYHITRKMAVRFAKAIKKLKATPTTSTRCKGSCGDAECKNLANAAVLHKAQLDAHRSQFQDLISEIKEYERKHNLLPCGFPGGIENI